MKIYSDTLTTNDLYACLPDDVTIADVRQIRNPHKRARGWDLSLEGHGERHTRRRNSGTYGADGYGYAATWDDHGVWMDRLYRIDPDALIAGYTSRDNFYSETRNEREWRQESVYRTVRETHTAPWLTA